jgi:Tfp pilus assembly protein PilO
MDPERGVQMLVILIGTGVLSYGAIALIQVLVKRLGSRSPEVMPEELQRELQEMRARIEDGEQAQARIAELEERLDFAERLLTQQREAAQLGKGDRR